MSDKFEEQTSPRKPLMTKAPPKAAPTEEPAAPRQPPMKKESPKAAPIEEPAAPRQPPMKKAPPKAAPMMKQPKRCAKEEIKDAKITPEDKTKRKASACPFAFEDTERREPVGEDLQQATPRRGTPSSSSTPSRILLEDGGIRCLDEKQLKKVQKQLFRPDGENSQRTPSVILGSNPCWPPGQTSESGDEGSEEDSEDSQRAEVTFKSALYADDTLFREETERREPEDEERRDEVTFISTLYADDMLLREEALRSRPEVIEVFERFTDEVATDENPGESAEKSSSSMLQIDRMVERRLEEDILRSQEEDDIDVGTDSEAIARMLEEEETEEEPCNPKEIELEKKTEQKKRWRRRANSAPERCSPYLKHKRFPAKRWRNDTPWAGTQGWFQIQFPPPTEAPPPPPPEDNSAAMRLRRLLKEELEERIARGS